jgi:hypothetical protein
MAVKSLIETVTVGAGGAASIEFTGIPQDAQDVQVLLSARTTGVISATTDFVNVRFNSNTSSVYSEVRLQGSGSGVATNDFSGNRILRLLLANGNTSTANTFGNSSLYVSNYSSSSNKSISIDSLDEANATAAQIAIGAALFASSAAITTLTLTPESGGDFVEYTTASLYKITAD